MVVEVLDLHKVIDTLYEYEHNACMNAMEADNDKAVKLYAQAHAFRVIIDMIIAEEFALDEGDTSAPA